MRGGVAFYGRITFTDSVPLYVVGGIESVPLYPILSDLLGKRSEYTMFRSKWGSEVPPVSLSVSTVRVFV